MPTLSSPEVLLESVSMVLYLVLAAALSVGGAIVEVTSFQYVATGETTIALWLAAIGALLLYAGLYGVGYQKVLAQFVR